MHFCLSLCALVTAATTGTAGATAPLSAKWRSFAVEVGSFTNGSRNRRRRLDGAAPGGAMSGLMEGNPEPLGYFFARLRVGTPGQDFTVIIDTGSSLLAIPCEGCNNCGRHEDPKFQPSRSSTYHAVTCNSPHCGTCVANQCTYREHFVEGSSIAGHLAMDQLGLEPPGGQDFVRVEAFFGCQTSETGIFKSQRADGIMGVGKQAQYPTLLDTMVSDHHLPDTLTFCISRTAGWVSFGAQPPTNAPAVTTMKPNGKYYILTLLNGKLGNTDLDVSSAVFNSGQGVLLDSGTSLIYLPHSAYMRFRTAFAKETQKLSLGRPTVVEGADCWPVEKVKGGRAAAVSGVGLEEFPTLHLVFAGAATMDLHPVHYMFLHPSEDEPTHWCSGVLDNGPTGTVLGAVFFRHQEVVIDRKTGRVHFTPNECGDSYHSLHAGGELFEGVFG